MKLTIISPSEVFVLDVNESLDVITFKACCECESGIGVDHMNLEHNGIQLTDMERTLGSYGIKDGGIITLHRVSEANVQPEESGNAVGSSKDNRRTDDPLNIDFTKVRVPPSTLDKNTIYERPDELLEMLLSHPPQLELLRHNNPVLAEAALSRNKERFRSVLQMQREHKQKELALKKRLLMSDPYDAEAQRLIAERIQQENINANMEAAVEYMPESFTLVTMLYINCKVNGFPVQAFVDSGAQVTVMSYECAERCNIMHLVDTRFTGIVRGVGTQKMFGKIHMVQVAIENDHFPMSFRIIKDQGVDVLLGLDMLKGYQCVLDLQRSIFKIGTTGTETHFLSEAEIPEERKLYTQPQPAGGDN